IKRQLSQEEISAGTIADIAFGQDGQQLALEFRITRGQFEAQVAPLVQRAIDKSAEVLRSAGLEPGSMDEVILVGGGTFVPYVKRRVAELVGRQPRRAINSMQVVAAGAAIQATALVAGPDAGAGLLMDVTSHS